MLESYDINKRHHYAHHKSFIDQVMFVVINGFIPKDNDIMGNGGRSIKVSCVPVGEYEKAKRDSYKRVYDDAGNFSYPHIPENLERKKGNLYWTNKTLCGTRNVSEGQFSLIHAYEKVIIKQMEEIARIESDGGIYDVVFFEQEDGSGCHNNEEYIRFKEREFDQRGWIRRSQSPQ